MKKLFTTIVLALICAGSYAQGNGAYQKAMAKGLEIMSGAQSSEDMQKAAGQFERIATKVPGEWHPHYYAALAYINIGFRSETPADKDKYAEIAQGYIDKALAINAEESEIEAVQGYNYMLQVTADPTSRGQSLSPKAMQHFGKAMKMDPKNPRAMLLMAQMQIGTAKFFGSPIDEPCALAEKALPLLEKEEKGKSFDPTWGKGLAKSVASQCGNK